MIISKCMGSEDSKPIALNWEYVEEIFNSYAILSGYRTVDGHEPTKELVAERLG